MKNKIKVTVVRLIKLLLPSGVYKYFKNVYKISKLNFEDIQKSIELSEKNSKVFTFIQDEFERTKIRSIIADGKLNYLLYGKVNNRSGTVDPNLIVARKSIDEINSNIDFTLFLRGSIESLKLRYRERLQKLNSKCVVDKEFLEGKSYIDLGAGNGHVSSVFHEGYKFSTVLGVDAYCNHFEEQKLVESEYINTDVMSFLSFTDRKGYLITAIHILEHLSLSDQYYFLKKCFDILEHGGYLYIEMPNTYNYRTLVDNFWADEQHLRLFPMNAFRVLSERIGYSPYYGVFDANNDFIGLDEYLNLKKFFDDQYFDIFLVLRKI